MPEYISISHSQKFSEKWGTTIRRINFHFLVCFFFSLYVKSKKKIIPIIRLHVNTIKRSNVTWIFHMMVRPGGKGTGTKPQFSHGVCVRIAQSFTICIQPLPSPTGDILSLMVHGKPPNSQLSTYTNWYWQILQSSSYSVPHHSTVECTNILAFFF